MIFKKYFSKFFFWQEFKMETNNYTWFRINIEGWSFSQEFEGKGKMKRTLYIWFFSDSQPRFPKVGGETCTKKDSAEPEVRDWSKSELQECVSPYLT